MRLLQLRGKYGENGTKFGSYYVLFYFVIKWKDNELKEKKKCKLSLNKIQNVVWALCIVERIVSYELYIDFTRKLFFYSLLH